MGYAPERKFVIKIQSSSEVGKQMMEERRRNSFLVLSISPVASFTHFHRYLSKDVFQRPK